MTREERQEKDLCRTCEHYWLDFPMPLDKYIAHCGILDRKPGNNVMDEVVPYPCMECPFNSYSKKMPMTQEEKEEQFKPKKWAMYNNGAFVTVFNSHTAAKKALHHKCEEMKKYPYDYADDYYTIKPYQP